jgi:GNAT superfamily N-acetyltransferase
VNLPYQVRLYLPEDRNSLEDLYRAVYGEIWRDRTNLVWTLDYPLDEAGAAVAVDEDRVVSAQPYCDFPLHTPWGPERATLFLDVATHPAHQRRGLFRRVVTAAREAAFARGSAIITTTPNRTAFHGFMRMGEWTKFCALDCMFLPLGAGNRVPDGGFLSLGTRVVLATASLLWKGQTKLGGKHQERQYAIEAPWSPSNDADELWGCTAAQAGIMVRRDRAFLQWRYGSDYRLFLARDPQRPVGYAAARVIVRGGIKIGLVLDHMTALSGTCVAALFNSVIDWLSAQGASAAIGYFLRGSVPWHQARAAGFRCLPRLLVPREYPVCASVQSEALHNRDLLDPSFWHMSLADSDLV